MIPGICEASPPQQGIAHKTALDLMIFDDNNCIKLQAGTFMRTTVTIDDALIQQALDLAEPGMDKAELFKEAIKTFVRVQAAKRLAALGASAPEMPEILRERPEPA